MAGRTTQRRYGARIIRRSEHASNAVKTGYVLLTTSANADRCTLEICNRNLLYPPIVTEKKKDGENLLVPLGKVELFAKHFDVNQMYWTLFALDPEDEVKLKIS